MSLEVDHVPFPVLIACPEEMVEPYLVERGGVGGYMSSDAIAYLVGADNHRRGVPPYDASYRALYFVVAGVRRLVLYGNGVHVMGVCGVGTLYAFFL